MNGSRRTGEKMGVITHCPPTHGVPEGKFFLPDLVLAKSVTFRVTTLVRKLFPYLLRLAGYSQPLDQHLCTSFMLFLFCCVLLPGAFSVHICKTCAMLEKKLVNVILKERFVLSKCSLFIF